MSFIFILMSLGSMSHVGFKKWPCRCVEFKGQDPHRAVVSMMTKVCIVARVLPLRCFLFLLANYIHVCADIMQ